MAWSSFAATNEARRSPVHLAGNNAGHNGNTWSSQFTVGGGAVPTVAVALGGNTVGGLWARNNAHRTGAAKYWLSKSMTMSQGGSGNRRYMLIDRLSHQGELNSVTPLTPTEQTTNLPTAALTRHTSGVGVCIGLQVWANLGATPITVTARYTNSAGTPNRVTAITAFPASLTLNSVILMPLADGDVGVLSVQAVTFLASTGTAGNLGVLLFKPLAVLCDTAGFNNGLMEPLGRGQSPERDHILGGMLVEIEKDACLDVLCSGGSSFTSNMLMLELIEER